MEVYCLYRRDPNYVIVDKTTGCSHVDDAPEELIEIYASEKGADNAKERFQKQEHLDALELGCDEGIYFVRAEKVK